MKLCLLFWTNPSKTFHLILTQFKIFNHFSEGCECEGGADFLFYFFTRIITVEIKLNGETKHPSLGSWLGHLLTDGSWVTLLIF